MTHLPYLIAAYGITVLSLGILSFHSWTRLKRVQKKLIQIQNNQQP
ncbi:unnamed protein product [Commensalibacter communis]|uniref:Heme exporter protein D n=1 Tax=Commensalibacter communis TaxID=2972786 RepID=A0A9W4X638_9PROT|nr:heme exporter protein CcmD [Commensalibacter communis]CAI3925169.1 unnamed protein product [Commensalibacter communis]CAI3925199.1 unnamed protein product [Commensalibacter communis]CAI3928134.1 unnamed protein product [Commensalibacter communis]CAI3928909.1 unnamed protein product [Commensalibacter communis]CAI3929479.1 unnamed protein product [Commensalibacter communis]